MVARTAIGLGLLLIAAQAANTARAEQVQLASDYRYAAQADKTFVRGDATVAPSKLLARGLRLVAPAAKDDKGAPDAVVATAVYHFSIPLAAKSLTIEVGYRPDAAAKDKEVAGLLFVRNSAMEEKAIEAGKEAKAKPSAEPAFFGNLYFLRGGEITTSVNLPAEDHLINGDLEIHLSAAAGQAFDAQYIQVSAYRSVTSYTQPYAPGSSYQPVAPYFYPSFDPFFVRQYNPYPYTYYFSIRPGQHHHHH